jgi:mono/diheme cytochrome c family protein
MAALLVIGFFLILGLGVFFVAMSGGPGGTRKALRSQTKRGNRTAYVAAALTTVIFGIGLPALVFLDADDQAAAGPGGTELSAELKEGRELFAENCANCHSLDDAKAVGRVGPDLDVLRPQAALTVNAIEEGRARGQGQMPAQLLDDEDARKVAEYIERVAGR